MELTSPAVLEAAVLHFILGGVWYGLIFGNKFIQLIGWTDAQLKQMQSQSNGKEYLIAFISPLVLAYVLAHFVQYTKHLALLAVFKQHFGSGLDL
jgi:hypothetical protein